MIRILLISLALLPGAVSLASAAAAPVQDPWYEIELIVFEQAGAAGAGRWNRDAGLPELPKGIELAPAREPFASSAVEAPFDAPADEAPEDQIPRGDAREAPPAVPVHGSGLPAFQLLNDPELRLATVMNRLMVSQRHTPLLHIAWRQPVTADQGFPGVHVHSNPGRDRLEAETLEQAVSAPLGASAPGALFSGGGSGSEPAGNAVEGLVRLSRSRFLHLNVDLRYRKPGARGESSLFSIFSREPATTELYRLQQAKRVRSGELQYFDHPRFGAIVLITPFDASARESGLD